MQANIPLAISAMAYGGVFGVLSGNQGVSWAEMLAMDLLMFAGSAQLVMIEMWSSPLPVFASRPGGADHQYTLPADRRLPAAGFRRPAALEESAVHASGGG